MYYLPFILIDSFRENVLMISALSGMSHFVWKKMRPENRYGQMTPAERVAFALSEEGKNYLFPWGLTVDGKRYEKMVPGRVAGTFDATLHLRTKLRRRRLRSRPELGPQQKRG